MSEPLFAAVLGRGGSGRAVSGRGWLRALLDVEAALASAGGRAGLVPPQAVADITAACADEAAYDEAALGRAAAAAGNPVVPLVREIERAAGTSGRHVHRGATSQDVMDTAMVLVARRALLTVVADLDTAVLATTRLARDHRDSVMVGRTLLQQAVPTTFGLKAAGWGLALDGARQRLREVDAGLPVQLAGAAGTLAGLDGRGQAVLEALAVQLELAVPVLPWHTARLPVADLAGVLGLTAGVVAKVATDIVLLAQTEVAEVSEGGEARGGSSAMPHKRNPVAAVSARAAARRAPGLVATLLSSMEQEHERAAGAWHAEWEALSDLLRSTGSAVAWLTECLAGLRVDPVRMRANLGLQGAVLATAGIADVLAATVGRAAAHDRVQAAVTTAQEQGRPLLSVLREDPVVSSVLDEAVLASLLDPLHQVGEAPRLVDAALHHLTRRSP